MESGLLKIDLSEKVISESIGCEKCEKGYLKIQKESIGWDLDVCDCLYEAEHLREVVNLFQKSNLPESIIKKNILSNLADVKMGQKCFVEQRL